MMEDNSATIKFYEEEIEVELKAYYSTKQHCNHYSDIQSIMSWWEAASRHWDKAHELKKKVAELKGNIKQ